jgi:hypothetical protein
MPQENQRPAPLEVTSAPFGAIARSVLRVVATLTLLFFVYALLPGTEEASSIRITVFSVVFVAFVALTARQAPSVRRSRYPALRATELLATALGFFIVAFSVAYLSMSRSNDYNFSVHLDHVSALYFTVVVFSTVGFGDIVAKTDGARLVVTIQILLDLVLLGFFVRFVIGAVERRRRS